VEQSIKKREKALPFVKAQKNAFIKCLRAGGGNVSKALLAANLKRTTAYRYFKEDKEFSDAWLEAIELATDELLTEARRRAVEGIVRPVYQNGKLVGHTREYSDTLLIYSLKHAEARQKWRGRIIQTGNLALETLHERGAVIGLTREQIGDLTLALVERFKDVSLI